MDRRRILKDLASGQMSLDQLLILTGNGKTAVIAGDKVTIHFKGEMTAHTLEQYRQMQPLKGLIAEITIVNPCPPILSEDDIPEDLDDVFFNQNS